MSASVDIRRLYEHVDKKEGFRVFVDRLWPRGLSKDEFHFDLWCKDLAPTPELRRWFGHKQEHWDGFRERYRAELQTSEQQRRIQDVIKQAKGKNIVLLYGAKDEKHNHALILAHEFRDNM